MNINSELFLTPEVIISFKFKAIFHGSQEKAAGFSIWKTHSEQTVNSGGVLGMKERQEFLVGAGFVNVVLPLMAP